MYNVFMRVQYSTRKIVVPLRLHSFANLIRYTTTCLCNVQKRHHLCTTLARLAVDHLQMLLHLNAARKAGTNYVGQ